MQFGFAVCGPVVIRGEGSCKHCIWTRCGSTFAHPRLLCMGVVRSIVAYVLHQQSSRRRVQPPIPLRSSRHAAQSRGFMSLRTAIINTFRSAAHRASSKW